jgi:hypothetical protein
VAHHVDDVSSQLRHAQGVATRLNSYPRGGSCPQCCLPSRGFLPGGSEMSHEDRGDGHDGRDGPMVPRVVAGEATRLLTVLRHLAGRKKPREGPFLPPSSCHDRPPRRGRSLRLRRDCTLSRWGAKLRSIRLRLNRRVNPGLRSVQGGSGNPDFSSSVLSYLVTNHSITFEPESSSRVYRMQNTTYINSY